MIGSRQLICGELHYPRVPLEHWRHRLRLARAMGLNSVSTYVFWNVHEERRGAYRFDGHRDIAAFVRMAQAEGLDVVLRPGPYVCAEWDFGGLPAWLLSGSPVQVRTAEASFMAPVRRWIARLGEELAPLHARAGGPIVAVQLENEYGAFGCDKTYLRELRALLERSGFGGLPFYTIDQPGDVDRGSLEGVAAAVRALRPDQPPVCGEFWAGWFDHWGEKRAELDASVQAADLEWMLANGVSVNVYMFHGGTNFALWNGANAFDPHPYQPTVTSYDYQAAVGEAGETTPKYERFRGLIARHTGETLASPPPLPRRTAIAPFALHCAGPLEAALREPVRARLPLCMEQLGASRGFVLYRTQIALAQDGMLEFDPRDYAIVRVNGTVRGHLERRLGERALRLDCGAGATLDILVENMGRINYGPFFGNERKGLTSGVRFNGVDLQDWEMFVLGTDAPVLRGSFEAAAGGPAFYAGTFDVQTPGDVFFEMGSLRKGVLWVNGHCAGRYWNIGPQRDLYVPGGWLQPGRNEAIVLELFAVRGTVRLQGGTERSWTLRQQ
ncbi:MAG: beta-galactosidase [Candidatus Baltobacteraceae bacterium]